MSVGICPTVAPVQPFVAIYQPLIVGLGAVVLGLIANTLLEWFKQTLNNRHMSAVMRRAVLEELRLVEAAARSNEDELLREVETDKAIMVPIWSRLPAYEAHVANFGLLPSDEVAAVTKAYAWIHATPEFLASMGSFKRIEDTVLIALVDPANRARLRTMEKGTLVNVVPATQLLSARSKT